MDYRPVQLDDALENDLRQLVRLSIAEDLDIAVDWTTVAMIAPERRGACQIVPRCTGIAAGIALAPWIVDEFDADLEVEVLIDEGAPLVPGEPIVRLSGSARDLLTSERVLLNILSRLCGVATLTGRYVEAIGEHTARLYDTRKTTPGWRRLEKYAVRCGGGHNHRTGLYDGFLIKDNHLALGRSENDPSSKLTAGEAATRAVAMRGASVNELVAPPMVEIEVDTLEQFEQVATTGIDIVLLDNFSLEDLRRAVARRDELGVTLDLEASGNVTIDTIGNVAATGVDRISSGALTHQATWLDLGMDWLDGFAT
ncbi:MAG: carboxylating nicotinate-nucleotide diphosphorylase [bacterium]|nr:carboxylating nicotinate-nucleotide diphosphorylase [bacterium]